MFAKRTHLVRAGIAKIEIGMASSATNVEDTASGSLRIGVRSKGRVAEMQFACVAAFLRRNRTSFGLVWLRQ
ncbi:MAG: hypothetical protein AKCLJLPJ_02570 [Fimbriimonadales bacterium]|nr:hypothetical protein [Fimbriimonadales bacterium]